MKLETQQMLDQMIAAAKAGNHVIPAFFQPLRGRSNVVSAAIRCAIKRGLLVEAGKDGCGNPRYSIPLPTATHAAPITIN